MGNISDSTTPRDVKDWVQVESAAHYDPMFYLSPQRMASIGYQFRLLHKHFPEGKVLEVGVGTGLAPLILRQLGHVVETLDVDERLNPDVLGSVTEIPCPDESYESFTCCQVLEHQPWDSVASSMSELRRISRLGGVISVPSNRPSLGISLHNYNHRGSRRVPLLKLRKQRIHTRREHHWELEANITTAQFVRALNASGFKLVYDIQPVQNFFHHFFVVEKTSLPK